LQRRHDLAFQVAFARPRQNRLGKETMLHPKPLFDGFTRKSFVTSLGFDSIKSNAT
jgi:hypothetical protein